MTRLFVVALVSVIAGCAAGPPPITGPQWLDDGCRDWVRDASGGVTWDPNDEVEGVETFIGEVPGSSFFAFRGAGAIDAPIAKVANVLIDVKRHSEWVPNFGGTHVVRDVAEGEKVIYRHVLTPAVIDDRDFVVKVHVHQERASGHLLVDFHSVRDPDEPPQEGKVRGVIHKQSGYRMWPIDGGKRTMVIFTIHVDPRGDVPSWIVNNFQGKFALKNIKNMRSQAAKPDVAPHPKIAAVFADFAPKCGDVKH